MITSYMLIIMTRLRPALVEKWQVGPVQIPTFHTRIRGLFEQQIGSIEIFEFFISKKVSKLAAI